jgi:hypothetical protein
VRVPKKPPAKIKDSKIVIPSRAVIYATVTASTTDGVRKVAVHGTGGFGTMITAKKGAKEVLLPSATIVDAGGRSKFVAWDGYNYVLTPTLESIEETDDLTLIGSVSGSKSSLTAALGTFLADNFSIDSFLLRKRQQEESERERKLAAIQAGSQPVPLSERPPLSPITLEAIGQLLHGVDQRHWPTITEMRVPKFIPLDVPVPHPTPNHLLGQIRWYASMLFKTEADQYEQFRANDQYARWLLQLTERVVARVLTALDRMEGGDPSAMIVGYHGLGKPEIEKGLREMLLEICGQYEHGVAPDQPLVPIETKPAVQPESTEETIGNQIERLRIECDVTVESLAEALQVDVRQIYRHQAGETTPRKTNLGAYQKFFSERLNRTITLRTSSERQVKPTKRQ